MHQTCKLSAGRAEFETQDSVDASDWTTPVCCSGFAIALVKSKTLEVPSDTETWELADN